MLDVIARKIKKVSREIKVLTTLTKKDIRTITLNMGVKGTKEC